MTTAPDASTENPQHGLQKQIVLFILIGVFCGAIDFGLTLGLGKGLGIAEFFAKAVGFIAGTTTAYILNRKHTFQAAPSHRRMIAVWILYLVTFVVQEGIFLAVLHVWPGNVLHWLVAYVLAQGTATVINFVVQRLVIFRMI
ncbi:GtrA family protein [Tsukamurella sp. 8F]|uniref:GtrA family protein n=1 Tax=unclassified Tsukamurella TaxID=2633480 RepID=UPI0023B9242D|nr:MULTISPECIES: GtrA family protein [unclassified Tsukamurella]MDF0531804.1 GtrA family protein [Tsukamurella sp. 8J]MDF0589046.1 GtrA family protein [Tsukamurella sp. 8F]